MDWLSSALPVVATLALVGVIWWPVRLAIASHVERQFEAAHPRGTSGYVIGAEPFLLRGSRPGAILVLHGFNDSPQAMSSMATALHAAGWTVRAPALPGHGRTMRDFARTRADDWERAAREELDRLRAAHRDVAVCGMSMGGALAFLLAASVSDVRAVVALAPYVQSAPGVRLLHFLGPVASLGATWVTTGGRGSVRDTEAAKRLIAYRRATPRLLRELLRVATRASGILARVQQPVLVFQSREDNRISPATAEQTFAAIGSQDKTFEWVAEAGHVISVDRGHDLVERRTVEWLQCRLP